VLKERGELDDRHGRLAFAVLLFQDIAAIPMIALVGLLAVGGEAMTATGAAWAAVKALAAIALVIVASRFLLTRLYRLIASTGLQEAMVASALLTVVIIGLVMQAAGLSAALGAFVAGVVLADSEYRHEVEANIAPFSGLLLGLFFVAVGMSIDTAALLERPGTIALAVAALVAVKAAVLWPLGQRMGLASPKARRLGLALSQGGEFAFVLASAAVAGNVIEAGTANLLNVVVALSMATTPFLLILDDRIAGRGKREETPSFDEMPKEEGHVVIAGLGRFGQIVARILRARKIPFTALDASPEQVDFVRRFGSKIYYGDASRFEILEAAQTGKARAFVLAIDDVDASLKTAQLVRRHYPHVPIYARARNRTHAHKLMDLGVQELERELFLSSLDLSRRLLRALGLAEAEARRTVNTFGTMDTRRLIDDYRYFTDTEKMRVNAMRQAEELEQLFEADARAIAEAGDGKA
jgi:glutathione-regulated potassium-efflux system protein KefB